MDIAELTEPGPTDPANDLPTQLVQAQRYRTMIVESRHSPEIECLISVAERYRRAKHQAYVDFLRGSGKSAKAQRGRLGVPGREVQSPRWREADQGLFSLIEGLATLLALRYPSPTGHAPINEARDLIEHRVGPLCTGWSRNDTHTIDTHHDHADCPIHPREARP